MADQDRQPAARPGVPGRKTRRAGRFAVRSALWSAAIGFGGACVPVAGAFAYSVDVGGRGLLIIVAAELACLLLVIYALARDVRRLARRVDYDGSARRRDGGAPTSPTPSSDELR